MRFSLAPLFALCTGLLAATSLPAQQIPSPYRYIEETQSLGVFAGYLTTDAGDPALGPRSAPLFGVHYTLRFTGPISGEALVGLAPSERRVFQAPLVGETEPRQIATESTPVLLLEGGLRFTFTGARTWHNLAPYALASLGVVANARGRSAREDALPEDQRYSFGPGLAVALGGGVEWFPASRLSLRLEARDRLWRIETPAGLSGTDSEESNWTQNLGLSLGAALHF